MRTPGPIISRRPVVRARKHDLRALNQRIWCAMSTCQPPQGAVLGPRDGDPRFGREPHPEMRSADRRGGCLTSVGRMAPSKRIDFRAADRVGAARRGRRSRDGLDPRWLGIVPVSAGLAELGE
jgi:hypothetical protein